MEWVDGQVLRRMVKRAVENGTANFGPEKVSEDIAPLKRREREIGELLAELGEDRAANLINRETMISATAKYNAELAEIQEKVAAAGGVGAWDYVDTEHLYEEFDGYELNYQRELVRGAFQYVGLRPRGRGSRRSAGVRWRTARAGGAATPAAWSSCSTTAPGLRGLAYPEVCTPVRLASLGEALEVRLPGRAPVPYRAGSSG